MKETFPDVVYSEMATWLGRTPCKSCGTRVEFFEDEGFLVADIKSMGRHTSVCCEVKE